MSGWPLMRRIRRLVVLSICIHSCLLSQLSAAESAARRWLAWRGPQQNGTSAETGLLDQVDSSAPVISGSKVYVLGYEGARPDLQQVLRCVEADSGKTIWEQRINDFLNDTVYRSSESGGNAPGNWDLIFANSHLAPRLTPCQA
jgi:hypothetical protein